MQRRVVKWTGSLLGVWLGMLVALPWASAQGIALRGVGAVNESMGGAATACPLDAAGAIQWNPASISGMEASEISFGMTLILPQSRLSSTIQRNALGPGVPPVTLTGSDWGEPGVTPVPTMAFVHRNPDSPWTYGLGVFGIGGSSVNYPASNTNPILNPKIPGMIGQLAATVDVLQVAPTLSYAMTERFSVGFAPTLTMAKLYATPLFLGPKDATGEYPSGVGTRYTWGGGFQVGAYYIADDAWHFGASVKSPQWTEPFRYNGETSGGAPELSLFNLYYPLIASTGVSYSGLERWVLACDVRYFDYGNTLGFSKSGFDPDTKAVMGLGWRSIMGVNLGAQRQVGENLYLRVGYSFNENPITSEVVQYNIASPLIIQHELHMGFSYNLPGDWIASLAYVHAFDNTVSGMMINPNTSQPLAGTSIETEAFADALSLGISKRF